MPAIANISGFKTVVYVDDQEVNILLMQAMLRHRPGLRLVVASSGTQAWELTEGLEPALLMLDIRLPDCTGIELLLRLRQHPGCRDAPAVAVTAEHDFNIRNTGFLELWTKPLHFDRVLSQLDALVGAQGSSLPNPSRRQEPTALAKPS